MAAELDPPDRDRIDAILDFWLGPPNDDGSVASDIASRWFKADAAFDAEIRERFGEDVERAAAGELDHWTATARGTLALVILADQFTRNIFRGQARAFFLDDKAQELARAAIRDGRDAELAPVERLFLSMPLMHAEDLTIQDESVARFERLTGEAPAALKDRCASFHHYAIKHREEIERFGRFPRRNAALGRDSTEAEQAFLASLLS